MNRKEANIAIRRLVGPKDFMMPLPYRRGDIIEQTETVEVSMPSKSPAQARLMRAAAHNPKFAKQAGVPQKVAKEFVAADKRKKKR